MNYSSSVVVAGGQLRAIARATNVVDFIKLQLIKVVSGS